jgi:uncharacterized protein YdhG (YjbR/CyaY superfamily)
MDSRRVESIDEYIAQFEPQVQAVLQDLRTLIRETAPAAAEKISYRMPTFHLHGNLVYFAAWKRHVGFYPTSSAVAAFASELTAYARAKGSIRFPLDEPLPVDLIRRMVEFRVAENSARAAARKRRS